MCVDHENLYDTLSIGGLFICELVLDFYIKIGTVIKVESFDSFKRFIGFNGITKQMRLHQSKYCTMDLIARKRELNTNQSHK